MLGYVYDVINVNTVENKTTKFFNLNTQSEQENYKCVCFSPEKHDYLKKYLASPPKNVVHTYLRIGKYDNERYLKSTERTTYTLNEDIAEEEMKSDNPHGVKSVRIRSYSGPYFPAFRLNTDQNNSEYGDFSRSGTIDMKSF